MDKNGIEIIKETHSKALEKLNKRNKIKFAAWSVDFTYEEALKKNEIGYFKTIANLYEQLKIKNKSHIKAVCDGKRSHVELYRIAYYDNDKNCPNLTTKHLEKSKKNVRKIYCVNDSKKFANCTEAGSYYRVEPSQLGLCARGVLKSVRVKDESTGKVKRFQFQYLDKNDTPIIPNRHREPLTQRRGVSIIRLINPPKCLNGKDVFSSLADFCRETGIPPKRARKYRKDKSIDLLGYEFIEIDN